MLGLYQIARDLGVGTLLGVPLHRDGSVIGVIILARHEPGGFDETQIALVETFAEQAVIAIASADAIANSAHRALAAAQQRIRRADRAAVRHHRRAEGDVGLAGRCAAGVRSDRRNGRARSARPTAWPWRCSTAACCTCRRITGIHRPWAASLEVAFPRPVGQRHIFGRAILARDAVHMPDMPADPSTLSQARTIDCVTRDRCRAAAACGTPIGAITLGRDGAGRILRRRRWNCCGPSPNRR